MGKGNKRTVADYEALAMARGFVWLGPEVSTVTVKTNWRCPRGHEWEAAYNKIQQGKGGCPYCSGRAACASKTVVTLDSYLTLAQQRGLEWLGPEVPTTKVKTRWRCERGHEWWARYGDIQQGKGCRRCSFLEVADKMKYKPESYHALAANRGYEWLGPEVSSTAIRTRWLCPKGHEWETTYSSIQKGRECPRCIGKARVLPDDYHTIAQSRGFEWLGPEVSTTTTKTKWRCQRGHEWEAVYSNLQKGTGCPVCNVSRGEAAVVRCLDGIGSPFSREKRFRQCKGEGGRALRFDFSFHYHNTAFLVEFDGRQHHESVDYFGGMGQFESTQHHDAIKTQFAADNGYVLIRIPYTVKEIETYLIEAIARHTGLTFEQVAFPSQPARPSMNLSEAPPVGIQIPLLTS